MGEGKGGLRVDPRSAVFSRGRARVFPSMEVVAACSLPKTLRHRLVNLFFFFKETAFATTPFFD